MNRIVFLITIFIILVLKFPLFAQFEEQISGNQIQKALDEGGTLYEINGEKYIYKKVKIFSIIPNTAKDVFQYTKYSFRLENFTNIMAMGLGTTALVFADQPIIDGAQTFGRFIGLAGTNNVTNLSPIEKVPLWVPTDFPAALYYLGDGITEIGINAGFYAYGYIKNDARAKQTAIQLTEGLLAMGFITQVLKHVTGRQSPFTATMDGGRWDWFPNQIEYQKAVPHYDAFPSGHLATAMMTVSIINMNYPEKKIVLPLGYTLMTLLGYQMLNNGVHWISDYPLALSIGYTCAKIAVARGRYKVVENEVVNGIEIIKHSKKFNENIQFLPALNYKSFGIGLRYFIN